MTLIRFVGATNVDRWSTAFTLSFLDFQFKNTPCPAAHIHLGQIRECRSHEFAKCFLACVLMFFSSMSWARSIRIRTDRLWYSTSSRTFLQLCDHWSISAYCPHNWFQLTALSPLDRCRATVLTRGTRKLQTTFLFRPRKELGSREKYKRHSWRSVNYPLWRYKRLL